MVLPRRDQWREGVRWLNAAIATLIVLSGVLGGGVLGAPGAHAAVSGQGEDLPATLVGPRPKAPIAIYLRPAPNQPAVGYGVSGSPVMVTDQIAGFLPEANPDTAWNHIRLEVPPYTEGWVQGRFLQLPLTSS